MLNIATGKAASKEVKEYMTHLLTNGKAARERFEKECEEDPRRFFKPIKKQTVQNFARANTKKVCGSKAPNKVECMRDSFIRLIILLCTEANIGLEQILAFPITQFPLSIVHADGLPMKTPKSTYTAQ